MNANSGRGRVVLITGASSGIGKCAAERLAAEGFRVYGTARKLEPFFADERFQASGDGSFLTAKGVEGTGLLRLIRMDVNDGGSIDEAVERVLGLEAAIDVLVNNAGFGIAGAVEDTSLDEARNQFDTNVFGAMRLCQRVLPAMRGRGQGRIINVGSVAGIISIPFQALYSASKFALEGLTEALRLEVKPFGIHVSLVEPGDTRTQFTGNRIYSRQALESDSPYRQRFERSVATMASDERDGCPPEVVARAILKLLQRRKPPLRVTVGAKYKLITLLRRICPAWVLELIIYRTYAA